MRAAEVRKWAGVTTVASLFVVLITFLAIRIVGQSVDPVSGLYSYPTWARVIVWVAFVLSVLTGVASFIAFFIARFIEEVRRPP